MKIYLLLIDHARFFFYSDESEASHDTADADDASTRPRSGLYGWFHVRYKRFRSAWQHADSGALLWMRRSWDWLHSWAHPDETMLARLWSAGKVDLHYPAARTEDEVRTIWTDYLRKQRRRHLVWLIVNGVISPFAVLFAILPGPNLIGYWFAYRAIHHALVVWGIRRVQRNKIATGLYPVAALNVPIEPGGDGKNSHAAITGAAIGLDEHVAWHRSSRRAQAENSPAVAPTASEPLTASSQIEQS